MLRACLDESGPSHLTKRSIFSNGVTLSSFMIFLKLAFQTANDSGLSLKCDKRLRNRSFFNRKLVDSAVKCCDIEEFSSWEPGILQPPEDH